LARVDEDSVEVFVKVNERNRQLGDTVHPYEELLMTYTGRI